jgi:general L-amino acid transport system substrate-binding protein
MEEENMIWKVLHSSRAVAATLAFTAGLAGAALAGPTLDTVRSRAEVVCGVNTGVAGFSLSDSSGNWAGMTIDFCKAVSTAVLGDKAKEKYVPLSPPQRFTAVQSGEVDLLVTPATWTLTRDASLGLLFAGVYFYDGQGFMVPSELGIKNVKELDGATICTATGTTNELNLSDYFRANRISFKPVVFESQNEARSAFFNGRCNAISADSTYLSSVRATDADNPEDWQILPDMISKEPLGPVVARNDLDWFTITKWTLLALINAEEMGITSANVDEMLQSNDPAIKRLLGASDEMGAKLGLDSKWAYNAIKRVGNYGEIYERNMGLDTPLGLQRKLNELWTKGGLMYGLPIR